MKKYMILAAGAAFLVTGSAIAQTHVRQDRLADITLDQAVARADARFARLDVNRDGRATPDEMRGRMKQRRERRVALRFDRLDLDRNGQISRSEYDEARSDRRGQRAERRERRAERRDHRAERSERRALAGPRRLAQQGYLTREQMRDRVVARFERLDTDRNHILTAAERRQGREIRGARGRRG